MKLSKFKPELITKTFFPYVSPLVINSGRCFQWAYLTFRSFEKVELWHMKTHAFVKYQDKFYDAERLKGVEDYVDLPATNFGKGCGCHRCLLPAQKRTLIAFKHSWRGMQKIYGIKWEELDRQALKVITDHATTKNYLSESFERTEC